MGKPEPAEPWRQLAADLEEILCYAGSNPDVEYMAVLLLENFHAGRYGAAPHAVPPPAPASRLDAAERGDWRARKIRSRRPSYCTGCSRARVGDWAPGGPSRPGHPEGWCEGGRRRAASPADRTGAEPGTGKGR